MRYGFIERVAAAVAAVVLALVGAVAVASPAQAATCATVNTICFFNEQSNTNPVQIYPTSVPRNTCLDVPDNLTSYINNRSGLRWKVFKTTNCTGVEAPIYPWSEGAMNAEWNNVIGSTVRTSSTSKLAGPGLDGVSPFAGK